MPRAFDLVLLDQRLPVVMMTGQHDSEPSIEATIKQGAAD